MKAGGGPGLAEYLAALAHCGLNQRSGDVLCRPVTASLTYHRPYLSQALFITVGVVGYRGPGESMQVMRASYERAARSHPVR